MIFYSCVLILLYTGVILTCDNMTLNNYISDWSEPQLSLKIYNYPLHKLCQKMFTAMSKITVLNIHRCEVEEIEANFLQLLSNVSSILITSNNIIRIQSETFVNLTIVSIGLPNNNIRVIEDDSFKNLTNLSIVLLYRNQLLSFCSHWFRKVPRLILLDLNNNEIAELQENSFEFLVAPNAKLFFDNNKILLLHENTMAGTVAKNISLFLYYNLIKKIPKTFFKNLTFDMVTLMNNPIKNLPEDFFASQFTIQTFSVSYDQFEKQAKKQLIKWSIQKKVKLYRSEKDFKEKNCSSKLLFDAHIYFLVFVFRQLV